MQGQCSSLGLLLCMLTVKSPPQAHMFGHWFPVVWSFHSRKQGRQRRVTGDNHWRVRAQCHLRQEFSGFAIFIFVFWSASHGKLPCFLCHDEPSEPWAKIHPFSLRSWQWEKWPTHPPIPILCLVASLRYLVMAMRRVTNTVPGCTTWGSCPYDTLACLFLSASCVAQSYFLQLLAGLPMVTYLKLPIHLKLSVFFWCLIFLPSIYCCKYIHIAYFVFSSFRVYWHSPDSFCLAPCCIVAHRK